MGVRMPDTNDWYRLFTENAVRRNAANHELGRARYELTQLLVQGQAAGLTVTYMTQLAHVSRETAHKLLREEREEAQPLEELADG